MNQGFIVLHRKIMDWYGISNPDRLALWVWIITMASHKDKKFLFNGQPTIIKRGQFITGRNALAKKVGISQWKVQRYLDEFEKEGQIAQQKTNRNRLITVINYNEYQGYTQPVHNRCTTDAQPVHTINNENNENKVSKTISRANKFIPPTVDEVAQYCRERNNNINPRKFVDHYQANGWMRGKNKIRDWKACVRTWEVRDKTGTIDPLSLEQKRARQKQL